VAGVFAIRAGDIPGARRHLQKLNEVANIARGPFVPHYRNALSAEVALAGGRPLDARPLLEAAVRSGTLRYESWAGFVPAARFRDALARTYLALGDQRRAVDALESCFSNPGEQVSLPVAYIRTLYVLGILELELGDTRRGRELLEKFLAYWGHADWDLPEVRNARARLAQLT
jgi:hypothetical protein